MQNWTYVGRANFGSDPGVSLSGYEFDEVLVIATVLDFDVYRTVYVEQVATKQLLSSSPSLDFYWIPDLGEVQLARSLSNPADWLDLTDLLITVLFTPTHVRTYKVRTVSKRNGSTTNYNTAAHGYIDVYCR